MIPAGSLDPSTDLHGHGQGRSGRRDGRCRQSAGDQQDLVVHDGAPPPPPPNEGPGGPILVVASTANPFSRYYAEILRNEGLNEFSTAELSTVTPSMLNSYKVVLVGDFGLTAAQATMFSDWVNAGGNLIAMRPDADLAALLGITPTSGTLSNTYLKIDTATTAGAGLVNETTSSSTARRTATH